MIVLILFGILWVFNQKDENTITTKLIQTMAVWHIWLLITIYLLSCISSLNRYSLLMSECIVSVLAFIILKKRKTTIGDLISALSMKKIPEVFTRDSQIYDVGNWKSKVFYWLPWVFFGVTVYISYNTIPYNWDSMTYHLPRIAHWAQNESVFPYATYINRQIGSTTLASYVCLYTYILAGKNDIFVNLIQGISYGIDAYMVYAIAKKLNVKKIYCVLSTLLFMSLPIAFAEAMTTQNDLFSTMWLLFSIYMVMDFVNIEKSLIADRKTLVTVFFLAVCFAFGYISKPAVCFAMLISLLWILICVLRRKDNLGTILKMLIIGITTCIVTVLPTWIMNLSVWGKISPDNVGAAQLVGTLNYRYVFMSLIKNSIYNFGNSLIPNFKNAMKGLMYNIAEIIGVDLNDAAISEFGGEFGFSSNPYGCDTALNPLIMFLALGAVVLLIFTWKKQAVLHRQYSLFVILAYLVFCCFLRWQNFISRYMVGYFALMCPMIVILIQYIMDKMQNTIKRNILFLGILALILGNWCLDVYYYYEDEPGTYFYYTWDMSHTYEKICNEIIDNGYDKVGLICGGNSYEYPIWGILSDKGVECEIRHVMVDNEFARYEDVDYKPDCIFVIDYTRDDVISYHGNEYIKTIETDNDQLLFLYERVE